MHVWLTLNLLTTAPTSLILTSPRHQLTPLQQTLTLSVTLRRFPDYFRTRWSPLPGQCYLLPDPAMTRLHLSADGVAPTLTHSPPPPRQVDYALEAVRRGTCGVGVRGDKCVILAVEKKTVLQLQDPRTVRKTALLDDHVCLAFAGLAADARVLIDKARIECQSHRLTVEDPVSVEYITRHVAGIQQQYTQSGGRRPFGVSNLIAGFDHDDPTRPHLFLTEPSGIFSAWKANAIGRSSKTVREFLEKNWVAGMGTDEAVKLAVKSLLEVVQTGAKNIELAVLEGHGKLRVSHSLSGFGGSVCRAIQAAEPVQWRSALQLAKPRTNLTWLFPSRAQNLTLDEITAVVAEIEKEKEADAERKKSRTAATAASREAMLAGASGTTTGVATPTTTDSDQAPPS